MMNLLNVVYKCLMISVIITTIVFIFLVIKGCGQAVDNMKENTIKYEKAKEELIQKN